MLLKVGLFIDSSVDLGGAFKNLFRLPCGFSQTPRDYVAQLGLLVAHRQHGQVTAALVGSDARLPPWDRLVLDHKGRAWARSLHGGNH